MSETLVIPADPSTRDIREAIAKLRADDVIGFFHEVNLRLLPRRRLFATIMSKMNLSEPDLDDEYPYGHMPLLSARALLREFESVEASMQRLQSS